MEFSKFVALMFIGILFISNSLRTKLINAIKGNMVLVVGLSLVSIYLLANEPFVVEGVDVNESQVASENASSKGSESVPKMDAPASTKSVPGPKMGGPASTMGGPASKMGGPASTMGGPASKMVGSTFSRTGDIGSGVAAFDQYPMISGS